MDAGQVLALLLIASPIATISALRHRSWQLMALAAVLALPLAVGHIPYMAQLLVPCLQMAAAVALRWRVGPAGWMGLLLTALLIGMVGGPGTILVNRNLFLLILASLVAAFVALLWERPPWLTAAQRHGEVTAP